jgi:putative transcriptional regulator
VRLKKNALKHIMVDRDLKLRQLQEISGLSRQTLSAVSNGKSCSFETAEKLAKALNLDVMELIEDGVEM